MANPRKSIYNPNELRLSEDDVFITVHTNSSLARKAGIVIPAGSLVVLGVPCGRQVNKHNKTSLFGNAPSSITLLEWMPELPRSAIGATFIDIYAFVCREFKSWEIFPCDSSAHTTLLNLQYYKKLPNNFAWSALLAVGNLQERVTISADESLLSLAAHDFLNGKSPFPQPVQIRGSNQENLFIVFNRNTNTSATGLCSLFDLSVLLFLKCALLLLLVFLGLFIGYKEFSNFLNLFEPEREVSEPV